MYAGLKNTILNVVSPRVAQPTRSTTLPTPERDHTVSQLEVESSRLNHGQPQGSPCHPTPNANDQLPVTDSSEMLNSVVYSDKSKRLGNMSQVCSTRVSVELYRDPDTVIGSISIL